MKQTEIFTEYVRARIQERTDIKATTKKAHRKIIPLLEQFGRIRFFSDLSRLNIMAFDDFLHSRNYRQTTIHDYHKVMKAYINDAIRHELISSNPYTYVRIKRGTPRLRKYLTSDELRTLTSVGNLSPCINRARDLFVFQCYTGLAYAELEQFDFTKVIERNGKYIVYDQRQKTAEDYYIVLLSPAMHILERYGYSLPHFSNQCYNRYLNVLAIIAGLGKRLTSHMARHTFAVWCLQNGCKIENLAKMMGHSNIQTTQIYAKVLNQSVEAEFERLERLV